MYGALDRPKLYSNVKYFQMISDESHLNDSQINALCSAIKSKMDDEDAWRNREREVSIGVTGAPINHCSEFLTLPSTTYTSWRKGKSEKKRRRKVG